MAKDLTTSRLDRQNILNNEIAVEEIQIKSGMEGILWEGKVFVTREMTASFFDVDIRTISRYIEQNNEELSANGYEVLKGKRLRAFIDAANNSGKDINVPTKTTVLVRSVERHMTGCRSRTQCAWSSAPTANAQYRKSTGAWCGMI